MFIHPEQRYSQNAFKSVPFQTQYSVKEQTNLQEDKEGEAPM